MNDDEWIYQEDDFNEDLPFVELQFGPDDLYILYECVKYRYEKWPGGHPDEQEELKHIQLGLHKALLDWQLIKQEQ